MMKPEPRFLENRILRLEAHLQELSRRRSRMVGSQAEAAAGQAEGEAIRTTMMQEVRRTSDEQPINLQLVGSFMIPTSRQSQT